MAIQTDLWLSKEKQLENYLRHKKIFASHEVIEYGLRIFYIRADRSKRDLLRQGKIRKLTDWEKEQRGYKTKEAVYEWVGENI